MALTPNLSTTFPYEFYTHVRYGAYPECFDEAHPQELHGPAPPGCGNNTHAAVTKPAAKARLLRWLSHTTFPCCRRRHSMPSQVLTWLRDIRGRRLDCANSYARAVMLQRESVTAHRRNLLQILQPKERGRRHSRVCRAAALAVRAKQGRAHVPPGLQRHAAAGDA